MTEEQKKDTMMQKIEKLLALSQSSVPAEANAAIAKANELMFRYNISMSDIKDKTLREYTEESVPYDFMIETKYIRDILVKYFFVQTIRVGYSLKWNILGTIENVAIAVYMYHHIKHKFAEAWQTFKKEHQKRGVEGKTDFYLGLWKGLGDKLASERDRLKKEEGLIWVSDPELKNFFDKQHPPATTSTTSHAIGRLSSDGHAQGAGYQAGKNMSLNKGINHGLTKVGFLN